MGQELLAEEERMLGVWQIVQLLDRWSDQRLVVVASSYENILCISSNYYLDLGIYCAVVDDMIHSVVVSERGK
jgi:hypothetical protein